jgi:hypothetical protein
MTVSCLRSGFCCKRAPCPYGSGAPCIQLGGDKPGEYFCKIHDEIVKDPHADLAPAFGAGCCSPLFNEDRDAVLKERI